MELCYDLDIADDVVVELLKVLGGNPPLGVPGASNLPSLVAVNSLLSGRKAELSGPLEQSGYARYGAPKIRSYSSPLSSHPDALRIAFAALANQTSIGGLYRTIVTGTPTAGPRACAAAAISTFVAATPAVARAAIRAAETT